MRHFLLFFLTFLNLIVTLYFFFRFLLFSLSRSFTFAWLLPLLCVTRPPTLSSSDRFIINVSFSDVLTFHLCDSLPLIPFFPVFLVSCLSWILCVVIFVFLSEVASNTYLFLHFPIVPSACYLCLSLSQSFSLCLCSLDDFPIFLLCFLTFFLLFSLPISLSLPHQSK